MTIYLCSCCVGVLVFMLCTCACVHVAGLGILLFLHKIFVHIINLTSSKIINSSPSSSRAYISRAISRSSFRSLSLYMVINHHNHTHSTITQPFTPGISEGIIHTYIIAITHAQMQARINDRIVYK